MCNQGEDNIFSTNVIVLENTHGIIKHMIFNIKPTDSCLFSMNINRQVFHDFEMVN